MNFYLVRRKAEVTENRSNYISAMDRDSSRSIVDTVDGHPRLNNNWYINRSFTIQMEKEYV